jgi:hypothetical protein
MKQTVTSLFEQLFASSLLAACPGFGGTSMEIGQECIDGKDNDGDGVVDCADADCRRLWICSDPRLDASVIPPLDFTTTPPDNGNRVDRGIGPPPPPRDTGPAPQSSYGEPCVYTSFGKRCPDGVSECVRSPAGGAFCSMRCSGVGSCPSGPTGSNQSDCLFTFNGERFCAFLCRLHGIDYECPDRTYGCYASSISSQRWCWPQ